MTADEILEAFSSLAGTAPVVAVEPSHITAWSVERTALGRVTVSPPDLERVTVTYDNGRHRVSATLYDRERDIVATYEMADFQRLLGR